MCICRIKDTTRIVGSGHLHIERWLREADRKAAGRAETDQDRTGLIGKSLIAPERTAERAWLTESLPSNDN
jgi:hypothetical protein